MANEYKLEGNNILSDKGKVVATLTDDGSFSMAPGMAGPHSRGVKEFMEKMKGTEEKEEVQTGTEEKKEVRTDTDGDGEVQKSTEEYGEACIEDIPEEMLPEFSLQLGVYTPGFMEFVKKHKLTECGIAALVKRLSR